MIILQSRRINHGIIVHVMSCHLRGSPIVQHFVGKLDDRVSANMDFALGLFMGRPTIICGYMFAYPPTHFHTPTKGNATPPHCGNGGDQDQGVWTDTYIYLICVCFR